MAHREEMAPQEATAQRGEPPPPEGRLLRAAAAGPVARPAGSVPHPGGPGASPVSATARSDSGSPDFGHHATLDDTVASSRSGMTFYF